MIRLFVYALILILSAYAATAEQDSALAATSPTPNSSSSEKITFTEVNVDGPYIAMTFDDGPHATNTPELLEMAAKRHIKLTFFVLGECVEQNPDVLRREVAEGHEIGYRVILWDVDPLDWKRPGSNVVAQRIIAGARPGSIILSHDIHPPTIAAMPQVFDTLLAKGFKFVTVSELIAMDKGGERPEVAKTPQARLSPRGHFVPPSATVPEVQPAQSPATATSPH